MLDKVKKNLYDAMCYDWESSPKELMISTFLDPRIKRVNESYIKSMLIIIKIIYKAPLNHKRLCNHVLFLPPIFAIFEQEQPQVHDEISEYLKEGKFLLTRILLNGGLAKKVNTPY